MTKPTGRPRGRPPKSLEQHIADGTFRADRHAHLLGQTWTSSRRPFPLEGREQDAADLYLAGRTAFDVADALGVHPHAVYKVLGRLGIERRPPGRIPTGRNLTARRGIPDRTRQFVYSRDGRACLACGSTDRLSLDHIVPWSLGGSDDPDNLQTLCVTCNLSKGATTEDHRASR